MSKSQNAITVLVVDDDRWVQFSLKRGLSDLGFEVQTLSSLAEARSSLGEQAVDVLVVDFLLEDGTGDELARWALQQGRAGKAFCITAAAECRSVVAAMSAGCASVLEKPVEASQLAALIGADERPTVADRELAAWRAEFASETVGEDSALLETLQVVRSVAESDCTVLVVGESGTGKELIARALHRASLRAGGPFVALNCAAIPDALIESELFGHTRGAFTGAVASREGRIAAANGGTLFLDEIGDMPLAAQAKLLRVLQERCVTPVGSDRSIPIDVRVVAATNKDLESMAEEGSFRSDLFYRLSVINVHLPPLRERPEDVLILAKSFLTNANQRTSSRVNGFDDDAQQALREYAWPGNIRQLENTVMRAVLFRREGLIAAEDLRLATRRLAQGSVITRANNPQPIPPAMLPTRTAPAPAFAPVVVAAAAPAPMSDNLNLKSALDGMERQLIQQALGITNGNRTEAAALLGLNRTTLVEKIRKLCP